MIKHTQIPSARGQPEPQNHCELDKNSENPERLLFFLYRNIISFKTLCTNFFLQKIRLYIFCIQNVCLFFFACTVHLAIDSHEMKCINIRSIREVQCVSYITCSRCKVNALNNLVQQMKIFFFILLGTVLESMIFYVEISKLKYLSK